MLAAAVAVLGPLSFTLLNLIYSEFYEPFGLVPSDVGLDATRVLSTSLTAFGFALAVWVIIWCAVFGQVSVYAVLLLEWTGADGSTLPGGARTLVFMVAGTVSLLGIGAAAAISQTEGVPTESKLWAWGLVVVGPGVTLALHRLRRSSLPAIGAALSGTAAHIGLAVAPILLGIWFGAPLVAGNVSKIVSEHADGVKRGEALTNPTLTLPEDVPDLRALDIRADVAEVEWLDARPRLVGPHDCLMYFGSSDGDALLWDVTSRPQALLRVPQSAVVIRTSNRKRCGLR